MIYRLYIAVIGTAYNLRDFRPSRRIEQAAQAAPPPAWKNLNLYLYIYLFILEKMLIPISRIVLSGVALAIRYFSI